VCGFGPQTDADIVSLPARVWQLVYHDQRLAGTFYYIFQRHDAPRCLTMPFTPDVRILVLPALAFVAACGSRAITPQPSPVALSPRCQAVADSVATITELAALPEGSFRGGATYRTPSLPADTPSGTRVLVRYVVRPDSTAEPKTVEIQGVEDAGFRAQALMGIRRLRLQPATIDGCPVRSRVDIYTTKM